MNGIPLKFGRDVDGSVFIQRIAFASQYSPVLRRFLADPRLSALTALLGNYEGRIGENEKDGLVVNHYVNTPDSAFRQLGWHTDSPRDLFLGQRILPRAILPCMTAGYGIVWRSRRLRVSGAAGG